MLRFDKWEKPAAPVASSRGFNESFEALRPARAGTDTDWRRWVAGLQQAFPQ